MGRKIKYTEDEYCNDLISSEIHLFSVHKHVYNEYEIICFNDIQAKLLSNVANEKFNKYGWQSDWLYCLADHVYKVILKKSIR